VQLALKGILERSNEHITNNSSNTNFTNNNNNHRSHSAANSREYPSSNNISNINNNKFGVMINSSANQSGIIVSG